MALIDDVLTAVEVRAESRIVATNGENAGLIQLYTLVKQAQNARGASKVAEFGDYKTSYQSADHNGWILANGRTLTTLTATQQTAAASVGIVGTLPAMADRLIVGASATKPLGSVGGSATATIAQNQLPNVPLSHSHGVSDPGHVHDIKGRADGQIGSNHGLFSTAGSNYASIISSSATGISVNTASPSLNGGVTQQTLNLQNPYVAQNGFIYLGA